MPENKMKQFDAIIIGSGQGGNPLALKLASAGWKTAMVEMGPAGGTCVNYGCTPTKTMITAARKAWVVQHAGDSGIRTGNIRIDLRHIRDHKNKIVKQFRDSLERSLKEAKNLSLFTGKASFVNERTLSVAKKGKTEKIRGERIFIDTGSRPAVPPLKGLDSLPFFDTASIMELKSVPEHLLIVGGGYNALEFGQMFRRFGSRVSIVDPGDRLLPAEDEDISAAITAILEEEGIRFYLKAGAEEVLETKKKMVRVIIRRNGEKKQVDCSHLLIATGRSPNTPELRLGNAGIKTDKEGYIRVNDRLETNKKGIYAIGDVKGGPAFTHISYNDHLVIAKNLLENKRAGIRNRPVPYCMFTDPQLGRVGLTEREARDKGMQVRIARLPMERAARAIETGETRGFMKAVVDAATGKILGAAVLGQQGGEIMAVLEVAMMGNIPYDKIRDGIFAHPTYAESLNNLFMTLDEEN